MPPAQLSHADAPASELLPASQPMHEFAELPLYVPATQVEQSLAPASEYVPLAQLSHADAPASELLPAPQSPLHEVAHFHFSRFGKLLRGRTALAVAAAVGKEAGGARQPAHPPQRWSRRAAR